jgi:type IV secretion system protein VirD4
MPSDEEVAWRVGTAIVGGAIKAHIAAGKWVWNKFHKPRPLESGFYFGYDSRSPYGKSIGREGHILVIGGSGSGKTAYIAIPTLRYFWDAPFLAIDIKGELLKKSGRGGYVFNPLNEDSYGYDPFFLVRSSPNPNAEIEHIAYILAPENPNTNDPFWIENTRGILAGYLLFAYNHGAGFIEALQVLLNKPFSGILQKLLHDPEARQYVIQASDMAEKTLSGILAQIYNRVRPLVTDKDIRTALSKSKVITPDLLETESIYIQIPEYRLDQWRDVITLIMQQFMNAFERRSEETARPALFLLDEFPRLGKMESITHALATLRSKKITICLIVQSTAQLDSIYGHDRRKVIMDNCPYKVILSATDPETQRQFSDLVGTHQEKQYSYSMSGTTTSFVDKPVKRPEEFAHLKKTAVVITPDGSGQVTKRGYWEIDRYPLTNTAGVIRV